MGFAEKGHALVEMLARGNEMLSAAAQTDSTAEGSSTVSVGQRMGELINGGAE